MLITTGCCGGQKHKQVEKHEVSSQCTKRGQKDEGLGVTSGSLEFPDAGDSAEGHPDCCPSPGMASWDRGSMDLIHSCVLPALTCTAC